jgi:hypothetical protein
MNPRAGSGLAERQVTSWEKVGVITGLRSEARAGGTETSWGRRRENTAILRRNLVRSLRRSRPYSMLYFSSL